MKIEEAELKEYKKIAKIQFESGYEPTYDFEKELKLARRFLEETEERVFFAKNYRNYIGYISIDPKGNLSLVIKNNSQGKGVGKFLIEFIIGFAKQNEYKKLNLEVRKTNKKAKWLYEKVGFKKSEEFELKGKKYLKMKLGLE